MTFAIRSTAACRHLAGLGMCGLLTLNAATLLAQSPPAEQPAQDQSDRPRGRFDGRRRGFDGPPGNGPGNGPGMGRGGERGMGPGGDFGGPMMRGIGQMMEPEFLRRDMPMFVQTLELDESQRPILETLLVDYTMAFNDAADEMRDRFATLRPRSPEQEARSQKRREIGGQMRDAVDELRELRAATPEGAEPDARKSDEIRQRMESLQKQMIELRPPRPEGKELKKLRDAMTALGDEWRATRQSLRDGFVADVQTILIEEQHAKWPVLERQFRREKTLRRSQLAGEGVDLVHVVRDMRLTPDEAALIEAAMQQYELVLDIALVARNSRIETIRGELMAAMMERDAERAQALAAEEVRLRTAVRTVNEQYVEVIAVALGGEKSDQVRTRFAEQAYPRIMRPTNAQRSLEAALELEGLAPETLAAVQSLNEQYVASSKAANADLIAQLRETEPQRITQRMQFWSARMDGQEPAPTNDGLREKFEKRFELDQDYRTRLDSLLTPEQIAQLPPAPSGRPEGGPDGGGRDRWRGPRGGQRFDRPADPEMMRRFDTNGDGTLDDQERQQMREDFRQPRNIEPSI